MAKLKRCLDLALRVHGELKGKAQVQGPGRPQSALACLGLPICPSLPSSATVWLGLLWPAHQKPTLQTTLLMKHKLLYRPPKSL